eukprot:2590917-Amphidinium_carterae.1
MSQDEDGEAGMFSRGPPPAAAVDPSPQVSGPPQAATQGHEQHIKHASRLEQHAMVMETPSLRQCKQMLARCTPYLVSVSIREAKPMSQRRTCPY